MTVSKMTSQKPKQLGQHVFNGSDERWCSALIDPSGRAYLHDYPTDWLIYDDSGWRNRYGEGHWMLIGDGFDSKAWRESAIERASPTWIKSNAFPDGVEAHKDDRLTWEEMRLKCINGDWQKDDKQQRIEEQHKEILALKALVNVQDEQLKEFESKENVYSEVLSETLQTLYATDPEARVSLTAGQLLQLTEQPNQDDLPFS